MTRALIRCDGATVPATLRARAWDVEEEIRHQGTRANLNLRIESPSHALLTSVADRAADLVRIASYVYAADQLVRRGGNADAYGDHWQRQFTICLPVSDAALWSDEGVSRCLEDVLHFASGDLWSFEFAPGTPEVQQLPFDVEPTTALGDPDAVILFSGGIDSLCAVVEAATTEKKRPLLVGHSPAFHIAGRQRQLARALRGRFGRTWHFPYQSFAIHRKASDPREYTQRTRSFLYATLGAVIADRLGLAEVMLPDNGIVSLNLPINAQLVGTKASRTTHPKFLRLFNEFIRQLWPRGPQVINPLWSRTRSEGLDILKQARAPELLEETNSCSHQRNLTSMRPHCGVCSQCIDRRFATFAAGLEAHDMADRYEVDIFRHALQEGNARTMAVSYVRFAIEVSQMGGEALFMRFPELHEAIDPNDPNQRMTAETLASLLRRHSTAVLGVMESQVATHSKDLATGRLPPTSLIPLIASSKQVEAREHGQDRKIPEFWHSPDWRMVTYKEEKYPLTVQQGPIVKLLYEAHLNNTPELGHAHILHEVGLSGARIRDIFRNSKAWNNLVVGGGTRGTYRLNVGPPLAR